MGKAIGQAMRSGGSGDGGGRAAVVDRKVAEAPGEQQKKVFHLEVPVGHGGEIECPDCQQPVAVGPTAETAICAACGRTMSIKRVGT